jgi:hypothetical protein
MPKASQTMPPTPRQPLWAVIEKYLLSVGGEANTEDLTDALIEAGHELGKYPRRSVSSCITSPFMARVFKVEKTKRGEFVSLRPQSKVVRYLPQTQRGAHATSGRS